MGAMGLAHVLLFVLLSVSSATETDGESSVVIASMEGTGSNTIQADDIPDMTQITTCLRVKLLQWSKPSVLITYGKEYATDFALVFMSVNHAVGIQCCQERIELLIPSGISLFKWHHLCLSLDLRSKTVLMLLDDKVFTSKIRVRDLETQTTETPLMIQGGGRLFLGRRYNLDQSFSLIESLRGEIAEFLFYNTSLSREILEEYVACRQTTETMEPMLSFDDMAKFTTEGNFLRYAPRENVCQTRPSTPILIPVKVPFSNAAEMCSSIGGKITVPRSTEETELLTKEFSEFIQMCFLARGTFYWLGLEYMLEKKEWLDASTGETQSWLGLSDENEEPLFNCVTAGSLRRPSMWYPTSCNARTCPVCTFTQRKPLVLRGLCKESIFDHHYTAYGTHNSRPAFEGLHHSRMVWENSTWVITTRSDNKAIARMAVSANFKFLPIGLNSWNVEGDVCDKAKMDMLFTLCNKSEFTCSDFSCIPLDRRCDRFSDCADHSDEKNCEKILPEDTSFLSHPPSFNVSRPFSVLVDFRISCVREFDLVGFRLVLEGALQFSWRDSRLTFANLQEDFLMNAVPDIKKWMWRPVIAMEDGTGSQVIPEVLYEKIFILREKEYLAADITSAKEDLLYSGADNTIILVKKIRMEVMCMFSLHFYPFDKQICKLNFINCGSPENIILKGGTISMKGSRELLEYKLSNESMISTTEGDYSTNVEVLLEFQNLYSFYIANAVIPTLLMVIICYLTFFFHLQDFQDRIMISLTSMLVLATLFTQTSQSIPKTSYFKLIDAYFVSLIATDFLVVVIHVIIENLRVPKTPTRQETFKVTGSWHVPVQYDGKGLRAAIRLNNTSQIVFPVIILTVCCAFFGIGFHSLY